MLLCSQEGTSYSRVLGGTEMVQLNNDDDANCTQYLRTESKARDTVLLTRTLEQGPGQGKDLGGKDQDQDQDLGVKDQDKDKEPGQGQGLESEGQAPRQ